MQRWSNKATNTSCAVNVFLPPASLCHSPLFRKSGLESRLQKALRDCKGGACGSFWPPQLTAAAWAAGPKAPPQRARGGGSGAGEAPRAAAALPPHARRFSRPPRGGVAPPPSPGPGSAGPGPWRGEERVSAGPGRAEPRRCWACGCGSWRVACCCSAAAARRGAPPPSAPTRCPPCGIRGYLLYKVQAPTCASRWIQLALFWKTAVNSPNTCYGNGYPIVGFSI